MVKFASNFCSYAVDQEKAVFQWKRDVSGPSALLGPEMVKLGQNFCYCAVDQEKVVFKWKWVVSGLAARRSRFLSYLAAPPGDITHCNLQDPEIRI